jgi:hypothetical protein
MPDDTTITKRRQALQSAMNVTEHTLRLRLNCYRSLVISVGLVASVSLLWAVIQRSWIPLLGFLLYLPLTGVFLWVDSLLIHSWRCRLLRMWAHEQVDLDIFCDVLRVLRVVPQGTRESMLSSLPTVKNLQTSEDIVPLVRRALAETLHSINACQSDRTLLASIAFTTGVASLALAAALPSWLPLLGPLLVIPILGIGLGLSGLRWWRWKRKVSALQLEALPLKIFVDLAARLDWQPIPTKRKTRLLGAVRCSSPAILAPPAISHKAQQRRRLY